MTALDRYLQQLRERRIAKVKHQRRNWKDRQVKR